MKDLISAKEEYFEIWKFLVEQTTDQPSQRSDMFFYLDLTEVKLALFSSENEPNRLTAIKLYEIFVTLAQTLNSYAGDQHYAEFTVLGDSLSVYNKVIAISELLSTSNLNPLLQLLAQQQKLPDFYIEQADQLLVQLEQAPSFTELQRLSALVN